MFQQNAGATEEKVSVRTLEKNGKAKIEIKRGNKKEKENKKIEVSGCQPGWCSVRPPPTNQMKPLSSHGATPADHILIFSRL